MFGVLGIYNFGSDFNQIFNSMYFHWWKLVDEFALFPCDIETNEATSTIISLEMFGKQNVISRSLYSENENFRFSKKNISLVSY